MKVTKIALSQVLVSLSVLGLGIIAAPLALKAESIVPPGYTLSKTPVKGKHCYFHGDDHANYYCYTKKLQTSQIQNHGSMMKPGDSMMKPGDSMMKPGDSMMKPGDSMSPGK
ncbi:MAG: hypothetical protein KME46_30225 [Brasilonema angustatum HA4187-MV1]|nr:hypothetical protein [Brasilonema angustatum HA4187-MV1]